MVDLLCVDDSVPAGSFSRGLYQSLTLVTIGAILPGNDLGRAFTYLGTGDMAKFALLVIALSLLAGFWLE
jgi:hypothetical protein